MATLAFPQSCWEAVNTLVDETGLHPWLIEKSLLWLEIQLEKDVHDFSSPYTWTEVLQEIWGWVNYFRALNYLQLSTVCEQKLVSQIRPKNSHERMLLRVITPRNWYEKLNFKEYQERFVEEVKPWNLQI